MMRLASLFWLAIAVISGLAMFKVKYAVQELEDELHRARKQTMAEQREIRVLNAEWSYLTQPERLAGLNQQFLSLVPIPTAQLQRDIAEIPLRPPPAPPLPAPPPAPEDPLIYAIPDKPSSPPAALSPPSAPSIAAPAGPAPAMAVAAAAAADRFAQPPPAEVPLSGPDAAAVVAAAPAAAPAAAAAAHIAPMPPVRRVAAHAAMPPGSVRLLKATTGIAPGPAKGPRSLDELFAQIAGAR